MNEDGENRTFPPASESGGPGINSCDFGVLSREAAGTTWRVPKILKLGNFEVQYVYLTYFKFKQYTQRTAKFFYTDIFGINSSTSIVCPILLSVARIGFRILPPIKPPILASYTQCSIARTIGSLNTKDLA